jgi:hypothetical protein
LAAGLLVVWDHELTPGPAGHPPSQWPAESRLRLKPDRATLVLFAHPHCPCTRASLEELARILSHGRERVGVYVLFLRPPGFTDEWARTDLWHSASLLPGVEALTDEDGAEARRFGARTSGEVALYDAAGRLRFHGGITPSRGHSGDNIGRDTIVALLRQDAADRSESPIFGCHLFSPAPPAHRETQSPQAPPAYTNPKLTNSRTSHAGEGRVRSSR